MSDIFADIIGRTNKINELKDSYKQERTAIPIVGLEKIGKSSIASSVFSEQEDNMLYIYEDLSIWNKYRELWQSIFRKVSKYLKKNNLMNDYLEEYLDKVKDIDVEWGILVDAIETIFQELKDLDIKVVIVLDKFDRAEKLFESLNGYWMIFRSIFSGPKYNVSAMTISKRCLTYIERGISPGSTFSGAFKTTADYIYGFDDEDMKEYFRVFEDKKIQLDDEQREKISYYCGKLPYLLSIMGKEILKLAKQNEKIDIKSIFESKKKDFDKYYRDIKKYLTEEEDYKLDKPKYFEEHVEEFGEQNDSPKNVGFSIPQTEEEWKKLIAEGEGGNIEFKSSIQYPCESKKNEKIDTDILKHECMKTIAAFLNTDGGRLFIGVEDKKRIILGIENDYSTFVAKMRDRDGFQKNLMNIFIKFFGEDVANNIMAEYIKLYFPVIDDKEICAVFVSPSSKPIYTLEIISNEIVKKDSQGNVLKDAEGNVLKDIRAKAGNRVFYVRTASSTNKLSDSAIYDYINSHKHFKK